MMINNKSPDKKEGPGCTHAPQAKNRASAADTSLFTWFTRFRVMAGDRLSKPGNLKIRQNKRLHAMTYFILIGLHCCVFQNQAHAEHKLIDNFQIRELEKKSFTMNFDKSRQQLQIHGTMDIGILAEFKRMLIKHPGLMEVALNSHGGNIFQARGLAKLIMSNQLNTYVSGNCYSACAIAYVAGNFRYMGPQGKLGFHQYNIESKMLNVRFDIEKEQARDLSYYKSRISSKIFVEKIFSSKNTELWIPEQKNLLETGVIHEVIPDSGR
jgi:ATP-dependent protease ClpP protease subunit